MATTTKRGEMTFLTLHQAQDVVDIYARGSTSMKSLAARYGTANGTIGRILAGKSRFERHGLDRSALTPEKLKELSRNHRGIVGRHSALSHQQREQLGRLHTKWIDAKLAYQGFVQKLGISPSWASAVAKRAVSNGKA